TACSVILLPAKTQFPSTCVTIKLRARAYRIQEGPVVLFHLEAFRKWRPGFHAQRSHDPVVSVVALQDDPGEARQRLAASLAQLSSNGVPPSRVQIGKRRAGDSVERPQHCHHMFRIAPKAL